MSHDLSSWSAHDPWLGNPAAEVVSGECGLGGDMLVGICWLIALVGICCPFHDRARILPFSWHWVRGRLYKPRVSSLEGSQCHGTGQEVKADPLVLAARFLNRFALEFWAFPGLALQLEALNEREGLNKDHNSVWVPLNHVFVSALDRTEGSGSLLRMPAAHELISVARAGSLSSK